MATPLELEAAQVFSSTTGSPPPVFTQAGQTATATVGAVTYTFVHGRPITVAGPKGTWPMPSNASWEEALRP